MQKHTHSLVAFGLIALLAGCEGTGPSTQNGAVTGGVLGAIAGGIIGNNSGGRNAVGGALIGGALGAIAGGTIGNSVDHQNGTIYHSESEATTSYVVQQTPPPPPPPTEYVGAQPTPNSMWIAGYYSWNGQSYQWMPGHWEIPLPATRCMCAPIGSIAAAGMFISAGTGTDREG